MLRELVKGGFISSVSTESRKKVPGACFPTETTPVFTDSWGSYEVSALFEVGEFPLTECILNRQSERLDWEPHFSLRGIQSADAELLSVVEWLLQEELNRR